jgi:hypothetical protein
MRRRVGAALTLALLGGCGGASTSAATTPMQEVVGNDAVRVRLSGLAALPVPASREVRALTDAESQAYCGWQARELGANDVEARCADGSTVRIQAACDGDAMAAMRAGFAECPVLLGEWAACVAARRAAPCDGGLFGEQLPECEAFAACIAQAMESSQASAQTAATEPE